MKSSFTKALAENITEILLIKVSEHYDVVYTSAILMLHLMFSFPSVLL